MTRNHIRTKSRAALSSPSFRSSAFAAAGRSLRLSSLGRTVCVVEHNAGGRFVPDRADCWHGLACSLGRTALCSVWCAEERRRAQAVLAGCRVCLRAVLPS